MKSVDPLPTAVEDPPHLANLAPHISDQHVDSLGKRHRERVRDSSHTSSSTSASSASTSGEEGYDSINSDEDQEHEHELQAGDEAALNGLSVISSGRLFNVGEPRTRNLSRLDDDAFAAISRKLSLNGGGDAEDGCVRDGPASLASSLASSTGSSSSTSTSCGPITFQKLGVTSDLTASASGPGPSPGSVTASPKRATFTIGTPKHEAQPQPQHPPLSRPAAPPHTLPLPLPLARPQPQPQDGDDAPIPSSSPRRMASFTIGTPDSSPERLLQTHAHAHATSSSSGTHVSPKRDCKENATAPPTDNTVQKPGVQNESVAGVGVPGVAGWNRTVAEAKEQAFSRLQDELRSAHQELKLRDEEVTRLSRIREQVEAELEELTASLFQEAHNMVRDANTRQAAAERSLAEARMQVEVLTAEVAALKTLVLTSTPARPNPHLHPQIDKTKSCDDSGGGGLFRKHRRSPSHFNLKYGRENSPPDSPVKELHSQSVPTGSCVAPVSQEQFETKDGLEVDPNVHRDFLAWRQCPSIDKTNPFIARVYREDINLCLDFNNKELAERVERAIEVGNIYIEAVGDRTKTAFPKKCALLEAPRQCHYRMKLGDQDSWHCISQICRNRITAVIDFLNYLRYIERGLVKSSVHDIYWEIVRLRKEMCLARLGLVLGS